MSLRERLMGTGKTPGVPYELTAQLQEYPRIKSTIEQLWGTYELYVYLSELFIDTRENTRKGFPAAEAKILVRINNMHAAHLESIGIKLIDLQGSEFASKVIQ